MFGTSRNRVLCIVAFGAFFVTAGSSDASLRSSRSFLERCHELGSVSKSIGGAQHGELRSKLASFKRTRRSDDTVPIRLRQSFHDVSVTGHFKVIYSQSRRVHTQVGTNSTDGFIVPTDNGGVCFGFVLRGLPSDCIRSFVSGAGAWVMWILPCEPKRSTVVIITSDEIRRVDIITKDGRKRFRVVNNFAIWLAGRQIMETTDMERVVAIGKNGRRVVL